MFDAARAAGDHDGGIGLLGRLRRPPQHHSEKDEAKRVEEYEERKDAGDHGALRNALRTAARATSVASTAAAKGMRARRIKSPVRSGVVPATSRASAAPPPPTIRRAAAATAAPASAPTSASSAI